MIGNYKAKGQLCLFHLRSHYTGYWHPTLHGQYFFHCLGCNSFWLQYGCQPQEKWVFKSRVYPSELNDVCMTCARGKPVYPKYNTSFVCCRERLNDR